MNIVGRAPLKRQKFQKVDMLKSLKVNEGGN